MSDQSTSDHSNPQPEMSDAEVARIERSLGRIVLGLPAISAALGHATVQDSLVYLRNAHDDHPERQLLFDMLAGVSNRELCERYFGSVEGAQTAYTTAAFGAST